MLIYFLISRNITWQQIFLLVPLCQSSLIFQYFSNPHCLFVTRKYVVITHKLENYLTFVLFCFRLEDEMSFLFDLTRWVFTNCCVPCCLVFFCVTLLSSSCLNLRIYSPWNISFSNCNLQWRCCYFWNYWIFPLSQHPLSCFCGPLFSPFPMTTCITEVKVTDLINKANPVDTITFRPLLRVNLH